MEKVEEKMFFLEREYAVKISEDEIAYITDSLLKNSNLQKDINLD